MKNVIEKLKKTHDIYVVAHRGANAECPENSMLAFETAVDIGADMIEFDVHTSLDGEIVVIHDSSTKRVSNQDVNVEQTNYNELQSIDIGDGQKIPKLDDLFQKLKGKIIFQVEIKQAGIVEKVYEKIKEFNVENECLISSFKHEELVNFKKIAPDMPCATLDPSGGGWISNWFSNKKIVENTKSKNLDGTHPFHKVINKKFIEFAHSNNIFVNPWTVDNPNDWKKYIKMGVDGIITNDPRNLIKLLNE